MSDLVIYHANCPDGFGAAWAASLSLGRCHETVYVPAQYGEKPLPEIYGRNFSRIFILDFSYDRKTLEGIRNECNELVVLDHHKTAAKELEGLEYARFDMKKSGAVMAWEWFHPEKPIPNLLAYVQDRDLWKWELKHSREVSAYLSIIPKTFKEWDNAAEDLTDGDMNYFKRVNQGWAILESKSQKVESLAKNAAIRDVGGYMVPVVNSPLFQSELGEKLCQVFPCEFSATYFIDEQSGDRIYSLRSRNGFDVSVVAKSFGGGGHPAAAGFRMKA